MLKCTKPRVLLTANILRILIFLGEFNAEENIVGGKRVKTGEMPYMIFIADYQNGGCGSGALVTPSKVTTAAHVLQVKFTKDTGKLIGGVVKVTDLSDANLQERSIKNIVFHPKTKLFSNPPTEMDIYNVACAVANKPFTITGTLKTLEFPASERIAFREAWNSVQKVKTVCLSAGWGVRKDTTGNLVSSSDLKKIHVILLNEKECLRFEGKEWYDNGIRCAISREQETSLCRGDYGGPLVCDGKAYAIVIGNISGVPVFPGYKPSTCNGVGVWFAYHLYEDLFDILDLSVSFNSSDPPNLYLLLLTFAGIGLQWTFQQK